MSAAVTGLTANTTYHFRISATNAGGTSKGSDETFKTLPNAPTVVTKAASSITQTTATLNATVNPNGGEVSECKFEYGTTESYGSDRVVLASLPGSGTSPVAVSAAVTGLTANTTYHFRISATNAGRHEQRLRPNVQNAAQPPDGRDAKRRRSITQTTATLNATVNPNGGEVSECKFEYGTTDLLRIDRLVRLAAGVGHQPGRGVRGGHAASPRTRPTTSGSRRPTRAARAKARTETFKTLPEPPDGRDQSGVVGHPDHGDAERDGEPQRRGSQRMQVRIRHHDRLRIDRVVRLAAGVGHEPGRGVRGGHGPHREHHLPLQDLGDQRGRHEQRLRRNVQNARRTPRRS